MALGINLLIGANLAGFKKGLKESERATAEMAARSSKAMKGVGQAATAAGAEVKSGASKGAKGLADLGKEADRAAGGVKKIGEEAGRLRDANGKFVKLGQAAGGAGQQFEQAGNKVRGLRDALGSLGVAAGAVSAGLSLTVGAAVNEFARFETSLNRVKALSGGTAEEMKRVSAAAVALGASTKFSAIEAADGIAELVAAGFQLEQALTAIPAVLNTAAADGIAVARAAEIVGAALNGFGLAAGEATMVADILAQTAAVSATSISEMGESLKYASTIAATTSQSIGQVSTVLAIMAQAGIKGSQAGTTYRGAMSALIKPTDDAGKVLERLKISLADAQGKMLPLTVILGQLRDKTAKMTEAQRGAAVATIFGQEALSGVLAVMKQTDDQVAQTTASIGEFDGASERMADTMNQGVIASLEEAKGALSSFGIAAGEAFAPMVKAIATVTKDVTNGLNQIDPATKAAGAGFVTMAGVAAGLVTGLSALTVAMSVTRGAAVALGVQMGPVGWAILALSAAAGVATTSLANQSKQSGETAGQLDKQMQTVNRLTSEYEKLAGKTERSVEEQTRMEEIARKMAEVAPELAGGIDAMGKATEIDTGMVYRWNIQAAERLRLLRETQVAAAEASRLTARAATAAARIAAQDAKRAEKDAERNRAITVSRLRELRKNESIPGPERDAMAAQLRGQLATDDKIVGLRRADARQAEKMSDETTFDYKRQYMKGEQSGPPVNPPPGWVPPPNPYKPPPVPNRGSGGAGRSAADEEKKRIQELFAELAERYGALEKMNQAFGTGRAGQVKVKQEYMAELKLKGLDKYAEGQKLVKNLAADITILNHETAKDASEKSAAALKARLDLVAQVAAEQSDTAMRQAEAQASMLTGLEREEAAIALGYVAQLKSNQAAYEQAEAKAAALAFAEGATEQDQEQAEALLAGAKAARDLADAAADAGRQDKLAKLAHQATMSYLRMADTLIDLAANPSLDKLAATLEQMAGDPEGLKNWGKAAEGATKLATEGWDGFTKAMGTGDPIAFTMWAVAKSIQGVQAAWEFFSASSGAGAINEAFSSASESVAQLNNRFRHGLITQAEAAKGRVDVLTAALEQLVNEQAGATDAGKWNNLQGAIEEVQGRLRTVTGEWEALAAAEGIATTAAAEAAAAMSRSLDVIANRDRLGLDTDLETAEASLAALKGAISTYAEEQATTTDPVRWGELEAKISDLKPTLAAAEAQVKQLGAAAEKTGQAFVAAVDKGPTIGDLGDKWDAGIAKLVDLQAELNEGERDDWGHKTSIASRALLDLTKERAAWTKRAAEFAEQETKAIAEKARIEKDRDAAIRGIMDEGIAVRAKTEFQDKTERINAVRAEADAKITAQDEVIARAQAEREREETEHEQRMSRIRISTQERIDGIAEERAALYSQLEPLRDQLGIVRSIAEAEERAARARLATKLSQVGSGGFTDAPKAGFTSDGRKSGFSNGEFTGAALRELDATLGLKKYHSGGLVPGPRGAEVPIMVRAGERVLTEQQQDWLSIAKRSNPGVMDWITSRRHPADVPAGAGGGQVVNVGGIHLEVHAAPGMSERQIADIAMRGLDAKLRRGGFGK